MLDYSEWSPGFYPQTAKGKEISLWKSGCTSRKSLPSLRIMKLCVPMRHKQAADPADYRVRQKEYKESEASLVYTARLSQNTKGLQRRRNKIKIAILREQKGHKPKTVGCSQRGRQVIFIRNPKLT